MSEFLKSAMGYFNTTPSNNVESNIGANSMMIPTQQQHSYDDFCGQIVEVAGKKLRIKRVIAEGGFAFVYIAQDTHTGTEYALKRLIGADKQACNAIINEINAHKQLSGHPNVVQFIGVKYVDKTNGPQSHAEYLLLTELCKGGCLMDCLTTAALDPPTVLRIFYQAARAVAHMHMQCPPVIHRDIKIENFLIGDDQQIKLCDFGSATKEIVLPTLEWGAQQRNLLEDQLGSVTTPMYRAPEMLDTWSNNEIGVKVDIWALGCILYVLCFQKHPFEDSAKLRIVNGNFIIPTDSRFNCFHEIIKGCLVVNPSQRFTISMILERLAALSESREWALKAPLNLRGKPIEISPIRETSPLNGLTTSQVNGVKQTSTATTTISAGNSLFYTPADSTSPRSANSTPEVGRRQSSAQPRANCLPSQNSGPSITANNNVGVGVGQNNQQAAGNGSLFSSLRGGAGNFLKNLKDTSSKVMQTMQQTIARTDLDISHITSRVLVMPCPSEGFESAYKTNNIEDVRLSIESRFPLHKVSVYNFGPRSCPRLPPPVRTVETGGIYRCHQSHAPHLEGLFSVAEDMYSFLAADTKSVIVIQTGDSGGCAAATLVCALLMYANLIREPEDAVQVFAVKRHPINLRASEFRYLYYFGDILRPTPLLPHYKSTNLISLSCQPVPRMTKARDGCRIYIEVYCNGVLMLSSVQEYEKMRLYMAGPGKIMLPINLTVCGDVAIVLYHARNALKGMVRPQSLKICQFQIHTGFIPEQETLIDFARHDLDDLPDIEQVPNDFTVSLSISITEEEYHPSRKPPWLPAKPKRMPQHLFSTQLEYEEMMDNFVTTATMQEDENYNNPSPTLTSPIENQATPSRSNSPLILPDVTETGRDSPFQQYTEPSPPIDLLNLNQPHSHQTASQNARVTAMPSNIASFDLLGAFGDDNSSGIGTTPIPDILADNKPTTNVDLDDIFGSLGSPTATASSFNFAATSNSAPMNGNGQDFASNITSFAPMSSNSFNNIPNLNIPSTNATTQSKDTSPHQQQSIDPFADIANLASGLNINFDPNKLSGKSAGATPNATSPHTTQYSSPTHLNSLSNNAGTASGIHFSLPKTPSQPTQPTTQQPFTNISPNHMKNSNSFSSTAASNSTRTSPQLFGATPQSSQQQQTQSGKADYSRSHFETPKSSGQSTSGAQSKSGDIFADILGEQGYKFGSKTNQGPRSINEMRKEDLVRDMDPDKVKIMDWTEGKKGNIRALLCSMHTVLWPDAKWTKCDMSTLITAGDVKKAYRRACLAVHPDKHNGSDNEKVAKLVFMELNNAWTDFENDTTQQNIFST